MYRLLQINKPSWRLSYRTTFHSFDENVETTCQSCLRRNYSAKPNVNIHPKKHRRKSVFADLLVVTGNSSTQKRASVQKLTPKDLKLLATTNFNLNELYKLKTLPKRSFPSGEQHTYNNLNFMGGVPISSTTMLEPLSVINPQIEEVSEEIENKLFDEVISKPEELEPAEPVDAEERKIENVFQAAAVEEEEEEVVEKPIKKIVKNTFNQEYAEEITAKTLASFVDVCAALKTPQRGLNAVNFSLHKYVNSKRPVKIKNIIVFNALLKGFASRGNYNKIQEVLQLMNQAGVELNIQSHVYILECLGRINIKDSHLQDIRRHVNKFRRQISFNDIMNEGCFYDGQREWVLSAMRAHTSKYVPKYDAPIINYSNHLLNHLNSIHTNDESYSEQKSGIFTAKNHQAATLKQIELEKRGIITVKSIEDKGPKGEEVLKYRSILNEHYQKWEKDATVAFNRDLSALAAKRSAVNMEPYLRCIPTKDFVSIIVEEAKKIAQGSETYSPTATMLYKELGRKVYARYRILNKEKTGVLEKVHQIHLLYCNEYAKLHPELEVLPLSELKINMRQIWQLFDFDLKKSGATLTMDHHEWVPTTLKFIGKFLYHIVMHDLKIDANSMTNQQHKNYVPAFYTIFRVQNRMNKEEVKPHPVLSKLHRASLPETLTFPACELPMICPPIPWVSVDLGGYVLTSSDLVRLPYQAGSQKQKLEEVGTQQIYPSLDALNQLSAVPWKVNQKILDVVLKVFNSGGSDSLDVPEHPSSLQPPPYPTADMDKSEKFQLFKKKMQYRRKKGEMFSLWCECLYRLSLANHFRDDTFWLPHNMDFRGRVYPIPPHLSYMGSDLARSMLVFAESRPLGPEGLKWLKLHLVNLTGLKKRDSIAERLRFADEIMDDILDSADNPLTGKKWWAESDEPWQTLACCMEIADAIRSPSIEKFRSRFPIHQDGSCNGLQHYAALGRDSAGAFSVNLTPYSEPQDVYSAVAALVEKQRIVDQENGLEIAKVLKGFIKRKVIKQTVMTTVYGVTKFGAKLQIAKQLKDIDNFPKEHVWAASSYLAGRTFDSIACMFTSTRAIQDWFTDCAKLISQVGGRQVEWVTPLGLPVTQPYFKLRNVSSPLCEGYSIDKYERPNVMKQKNAFPPNFIHSLDSSHMMLTSLHCERSGITFVSVHDCYWTHPSTVHIMNKICREQFVKLHSEPILEDLSYFLVRKYSYGQSDFSNDGSVTDLSKMKLNRVLKQLPKTGDFDLNQVLHSTYFFIFITIY